MSPTDPSAATSPPAPSGPPTPFDADVAIVGGSMAGLTAALVLARARRRVVVIDAGEPINQGVAHSQGYPTRDGTPPGEILDLLRAEVRGYGVELVDGFVDSIDRLALATPASPSAPTPTTPSAPTPTSPAGSAGSVAIAAAASPLGSAAFASSSAAARFEVSIRGSDAPRRARRVVLAHGASLVLPELLGLAEVWASDAATCPYCHGWELRDRPLAVFGEPVRLGHLAWMISQWSDDVVVFAPDDVDLTEATRAGVRRDRRVPVRAVVGDDGHLSGLELDDGSTVPVTGLFVAAQAVPNTELAERLGAAVGPMGFVAADRDGTTTAPGVWAVGNVVDGSHQLTGAADSGTRAARAINLDLLAEDVAART